MHRDAEIEWRLLLAGMLVNEIANVKIAFQTHLLVLALCFASIFVALRLRSWVSSGLTWAKDSTNGKGVGKLGSRGVEGGSYKFI